MKTSNPAFANDAFASDFGYLGERSLTMTVQGTALKTLALLGLLFLTASWAWTQAGAGTIAPRMLIGSVIGALIVGLITVFKPTASPYTAPVYAGLEGILLGALSRVMEARYPGIAVQAVGLTGGTLFVMLFIYTTRMIRVTDKLIMGVTAATGAICLFYFVTFLLRMFGVSIPYIHGPNAGLIGIGFSLFVVGVAAFNLLLDFDQIEKGEAYGAPKYMEWYGAFGLMVTLIWLYLEILRLLAKLADRRN